MKRLGTLFLLLFCAFAWSEDDLVIKPRARKPPLTADDVARFRKSLGDRDLAKVSQAADELARSGDETALQLLANLYDNGDAQRRLLAVRAIDQLNVAGQDDILLRIAVGDPFIAVRLAAATALGKSPNAARNIDRLASVVDSPPTKNTPPVYMHRAVQAVARIAGPIASGRLVAWLSHPSPEIASAAADGLGSIGETAHSDALYKALTSSDTELKPAAADALERISGEKYRFDLVKWNAWLKNKEVKKSPPGVDTSYGGYDDLQGPAYTDIVIVFDTTGSMTHIWPQLCNAIDAVLAQMIKQSSSLRMGLVLYRADAPELSMKYTIKPLTLTRDTKRIREQMDDASFGGGSGGVHLGLDFALKAMPWRAHARKVVILIGDTSPLSAGVQACAQSIREAWEIDRILTTTLYVRTLHGDEHRQTYRLLSTAGAGRFFEYNKAESHLVELSTEKVDVKNVERPEETARKWFLPREKK